MDNLFTERQTSGLSRRRFMTGAAASLAMVGPQWALAQDAQEKITLGIIGCGGRGTWIADLFTKHGGYQFVAAADYFEDRVNTFGDRFGVDASRRYTGLKGYQRLLEKPPQAIVVESPPFFHPEQAMAGVDAGCHVYVAKPIAVDVPGCQTILEAGEKASKRNLCMLIDFQTRANDLYREAVKRVHYGEIGRVFCGEAAYLTGRLGKQADPGTPEARLKNWVFDKALSGDVITEQNIHALDVACWILNADPVKAWGTGGRKVRTDLGDCWDHFSVIYTFPDDVPLTFHSKQAGQGIDDIACRVYGATGTIDTHYFGKVSITGERPYEGGQVANLYSTGAVKNIEDFHENILKGQVENGTVPKSVQSNLTTILGRTAAYEGRVVTWEEMMKANARLEPDLSGLKA